MRAYTKSMGVLWDPLLTGGLAAFSHSGAVRSLTQW